MIKKTLLSLALGAGLIAALSSSAKADPWDHHRYDGWWTAHHDYAVEVQAHPEYLHDHAWLGRHHDVQVWVNANPGFVSGYVAQPYPIIVEGGHHNGHWHRYADHHWGW